MLIMERELAAPSLSKVATSIAKIVLINQRGILMVAKNGLNPLELVNRSYITRVSILGGEPLADENVIEIYSLVSRIKNECNKKIWLYTGYTWEYLVKENRLTQRLSFNDFYDSDNEKQLFKIVHRSLIIPFIDVLVDGQYVDELRNINLPFRGSSNQRLIDVKKTLNSFTIGDNRIIEYKIN